MNVGIAAHKASLHGGIRLLHGLSLNPSLVWIGERWGYARYDEEGEPLMERFAPMLLANLNLQYQNLLPGLSLSVGVHNLLNHDNAFVQAYNGESSPVPGPGRELTLKASYDLKFKK
jgi:hypothetical protein